MDYMMGHYLYISWFQRRSRKKDKMYIQVSFISTSRNEDLDKIIDLFKKYNIRNEDDELCSCCAKVTLNKQIKSTVDKSRGLRGNSKIFEKGKQFLVLQGDICCQRNSEYIFKADEIQYTNEELDLIYKINIIFADYIPYDDILKNKEYATIDELCILGKMIDIKYMTIANKIAEELKIEGKDVEQCKKQVKAVCDRYGMDLEIEDWAKNSVYDRKTRSLIGGDPKVTNLFVKDIFDFQIETSNKDGKIRYLLGDYNRLPKKIACFLEAKNK